MVPTVTHFFQPLHCCLILPWMTVIAPSLPFCLSSLSFSHPDRCLEIVPTWPPVAHHCRLSPGLCASLWFSLAPEKLLILLIFYCSRLFPCKAGSAQASAPKGPCPDALFSHLVPVPWAPALGAVCVFGDLTTLPISPQPFAPLHCIF